LNLNIDNRNYTNWNSKGEKDGIGLEGDRRILKSLEKYQMV
jgi:hypothetical protein